MIDNLKSKISSLVSGKMGSTIVMAFIVAVCVMAAIISIKVLGKNNPVEQFAEKIIEIETGKEIDFSEMKEKD